MFLHWYLDNRDPTCPQLSLTLWNKVNVHRILQGTRDICTFSPPSPVPPYNHIVPPLPPTLLNATQRIAREDKHPAAYKQNKT
jgi:hypothetical protein